MRGRVLIIAGSDSGGGAGIQADIKAVTALGGYAATAITAITVQDTVAVHDIFQMSPEIVRKQIEVVLDDIGADAFKIGMIGTASVAEAVISILERNPAVPVVFDPVLVATSGDALAGEGLAELFLKRLVPLSTIITPNIPELRALTGEVDEQKAVDMLLSRGAKHVLVKGGHEEEQTVTDRLYSVGAKETFESVRIETTSTHGTGCTLCSAIAAGIAQGLSVSTATERAVRYVHDAIEAAPGFGRGHGPIAHTVWNAARS
ncbi:bifunctional hydroxymethylpyrimidine kinase/phosphomethylpyrimidine kinase [Parvularcula maris]|uniref:hydroxymethylpyrimidine kinase n=1 Tax=Parvularcula maris TaxID=2965077 RepID=A0A9X2RHY0_9PROT|nr:bifunctional hydroxymethylpyrimidine kinase/phosphomethylpyrimidine kinase [Parvularcula maris]